MSYGYVEAVMRCGDPVKIKVLIERLKSLNNLLDATGQEAYLYEDFVAVLPDLLEEMITKFPTLNNEETLLSRFNDLETANAITQHFRVRFPRVVLGRYSAILISHEDDHQCVHET